MMQKKIAKKLVLFTFIVGLVGILFFFWYIPGLIAEMAIMMPEAAWLRWPGTIGIWVIALLCYLALWEFVKICNRIGADNSFSMENACSMKRIGNLAILTGLLILGGDFFLVVIGYLNGAWILASFFSMFIALGIAVLCRALSSLIQNAAEMKAENDLTI